jgi:hypothetical protein
MWVGRDASLQERLALKAFCGRFGRPHHHEAPTPSRCSVERRWRGRCLLGRAHTKEEPEWASGAYAWSVLFHLFFVTLLPFSMIVVGRYDLAPAIWVYGANMVLLALTAIVITLVIERDIGRRLVPSGRPEYGVLIASAILSVVIGFYSPDSAMYAYFLNLASPLVRRWTDRV